VANCTVTDIFDSGITPQTYDSNQSASGFTFTGNTISKCGFAGIEIAVLRNTDKFGSSISNVTVKNNTISNCGEGFSGIRYGNEGRGIKIADDSGAGEISGVSVDRCFLVSNQTGIFVSGNTDVVQINKSGFRSNGYGVAAYDIQGATTLKIKISSSLFYLNTIGFGYNVDNGNGNIFELYHNTFYDNSTVALSVASFKGTPVLKNNIFYASTDRLQIFSTTFTGYIINNNCFRQCNRFIAYGTVSSPEYYNTILDWGYNNGTNVISDPLFVDASGCNFDLLSGSSCITKGVSGTGVVTDYSGKAFHSTTPSIGAYEY
jgi:hypothetical protein